MDVAATMWEKRDQMVNVETGAGKSFCFQIPLLYDPGKIIFVICPLLSLMRDQVF